MLASFYFKVFDTFKQYLQYGKLIETELLFFESYISTCLIHISNILRKGSKITPSYLTL